jgi:hypothetical protein
MDINTIHSAFMQFPFGPLALKKLAPVSEDFRIFSVGWMKDDTEECNVMQVKGGQFRVAKAGPNKGKLSILVKGTTRIAYVSREEMTAYEKKMAEGAKEDLTVRAEGHL